MACDPGSSSSALIVPYADTIQFMDFSTEYINVEKLALRSRNAVSTAEGVISVSKAQVKAFCLTQD